MASRKVVWSRRAILDRAQILEYWVERNKSSAYSNKLNTLFNITIRSIQVNPNSGRQTSLKSIRERTVRDYQVIYEILREGSILIIAIWDTRRNPSKKFTP